MMDGAVAAASARLSKRYATGWHVFVALISLATALPMLLVPYARHVMTDTETALGMIAALNFLGANFHVAASGLFLTDAEMRGHFRAHPIRYLVVPVTLISAGAVAFQIADWPVRHALVIAFLSWQLWHYHKQNIGVLSFMAAGTGSGPLSAWERRALAAAAVAGILGYFSHNPAGPPHWTPYFSQFHQLGLAIYGLVPFLVGIALASTPGLRQSPTRLAYLLIGAVFFLPTYLFDDPISATLGYALAHGLQYLVFMGLLSVRKRAPLASLLMLAGMSTVGALLLKAALHAPVVSESPYRFALYGIFVGIVTSHFVLDAGVWRLREPFQRGWMRQRFFFVFDR